MANGYVPSYIQYDSAYQVAVLAFGFVLTLPFWFLAFLLRLLKVDGREKWQWSAVAFCIAACGHLTAYLLPGDFRFRFEIYATAAGFCIACAVGCFGLARARRVPVEATALSVDSHMPSALPPMLPDNPPVTPTKNSWWRRLPLAVRTWLFLSSVWSPSAVLLSYVFDWFDYRYAWRAGDYFGVEGTQVWTLALLPWLGGFVWLIYENRIK